MAHAGLIPVVLAAALAVAVVVLAIAFLRTRSEAAKRTTERDAYMGVLNAGHDALLVIDLVSGAILNANASAATMLGHRRDHLLTLRIFDLHAPEFLEHSATRIADAWENKGLTYADIPFCSATKERIDVECSTSVTYVGQRPAVVIFARDIRERLRLETEVRERGEELQASLRYAGAIQQAVLPGEAAVRAAFADAFLLYLPRDVVSGDFHWCARTGDHVVVAVADCTGHGVPGAFLSLIGNSLLRSTVIEKGVTEPAAILNELRTGIIRALHADGGSSRDGMDIALLVVDKSARTARFAGAFNPLYVVRQAEQGPELIEHKADRMPIGFAEHGEKPFTSVELDLRPGDRLYLFSDGFADQFGGNDGRKLKSAGLKNILIGTLALPMPAQRDALLSAFQSWRGAEPQVDDVTVVGLLV